MPRLRDLPWRDTRDPWAVLVSEVMLQQTQVPRVLPKWQAFMAQYPTAAACAEASLGDVLRLWQGLGYPRRARNLQAAAVEVKRLGGFPRDLAGLLALPGIGQYTARAVLAFAFERDVAVVDTNIARVYARTQGRRLTAKEVQALADAAVPRGMGWAWNQCLMDLGATVCRSTPNCAECPLRARCAWRGVGDDPAVGSAGVSRVQGRFEGSERQARGRLMKALSAGAVETAAAVPLMRHAAAERLIADLLSEGLIATTDGVLHLP
ncbi:MAG: A/G-specific adenine glycosylase [Ilumatobacteraceae bacterium]